MNRSREEESDTHAHKISREGERETWKFNLY